MSCVGRGFGDDSLKSAEEPVSNNPHCCLELPIKDFEVFMAKTNNRNSPASQLAIFAHLFVDSWLVGALPTSRASSL